MNVHVDAGRVYLKVQEEGYLLPFGNEAFVGHLNGFGKIRVAHVTPVDKQELMGIFLL